MATHNRNALHPDGYLLYSAVEGNALVEVLLERCARRGRADTILIKRTDDFENPRTLPTESTVRLDALQFAEACAELLHFANAGGTAIHAVVLRDAVAEAFAFGRAS